MKKYAIVSLFLILSQAVLAQTIEIAGPTKNNRMLLDTLLEAARFRDYFFKFSDSLVEIAAKEKKWDSLEVRKRKAQIKYDHGFKDDIYISYSTHTKSDIETLIKFCKEPSNTDMLPQVILQNGPFLQSQLVYSIKKYFY